MKQNTFTGDNRQFLENIKRCINAENIDIIVSFLMEFRVKLIIDDLKNSNAKIRILTGNYLNITQPEALYILKRELSDLDLRFYDNPNKSFHPKAYIFHNFEDSEIYVGSSNLSRELLQHQLSGIITLKIQKIHMISMNFKIISKISSTITRLKLLMTSSKTIPKIGLNLKIILK